jgi:hypothetical protein
LNKRKKKHCTKVGETFLMIHPLPAASIWKMADVKK